MFHFVQHDKGIDFLDRNSANSEQKKFQEKQ